MATAERDRRLQRNPPSLVIRGRLEGTFSIVRVLYSYNSCIQNHERRRILRPSIVKPTSFTCSDRIQFYKQMYDNYDVTLSAIQYRSTV